jgi:hypothetical protein
MDLTAAYRAVNDHDFLWRVAGACVSVAGTVLATPDAAKAAKDLAKKAIWEWTEIGLVAARYLVYVSGLTPDTDDAHLIAALSAAWPHLSGPSDSVGPSEE